MTNSDQQSVAESALDQAVENNMDVNRMLAESNGISAIDYTGSVGYHVNIADGMTDPQYLWKVALLQALDDIVFPRMYVDGTDVDFATQQMEPKIREWFDARVADQLVDQFETKLTALIEDQENNE